MNNKSFTLIELLVVIVIIGILAGVIMISTSSSIGRANVARSKVFEQNIENNLAANMVSRWKLDDKNGVAPSLTTSDSWGNSIGTLYGTSGSQSYPQLQNSSECITNGCYKFDGTDDYIDCGSSDSFNFTFGGVSISSWAKKGVNGTAMRIVHKGGQSNSNYDYSIGFNGDNAIFFAAQKTSDSMTNGQKTTNAYTSLTDWYYVVGTYDSSTLKIYVNGVLQAIGVSSTSNTATNALQLGQKLDNTQRMNGLLDDVRIYNATLSAYQIKQNYVAGLGSLLSKSLISKEEYDQKLSELALK